MATNRVRILEDSRTCTRSIWLAAHLGSESTITFVYTFYIFWRSWFAAWLIWKFLRLWRSGRSHQNWKLVLLVAVQDSPKKGLNGKIRPYDSRSDVVYCKHFYMLHPDTNNTSASPVHHGAVIWLTPLCHTQRCSFGGSRTLPKWYNYKRTLQYRHYTETSHNVWNCYAKFYVTFTGHTIYASALYGHF